jgi:hypothetical protein
MRETMSCDAERYVRERWPKATCDGPGKVYWPGQGERRGWIVTRSQHWSGVDGFGITETAAWADAANRLEKREKQA